MLEKLRPYQSGLVFVLIAAGFVALLISGLGSANRVECSLCVEFNGRRNCGSGTGDTEKDAMQSAQMVACAAIVSGVNDAFRCSGTPGQQVTCNTP